MAELNLEERLINGIWDTLKKDIRYQDRKNGATVSGGKSLFLESDLLQMTKEEDCKAVKGNCYDNINVSDSNNKFGGIEVKFEEPKEQITYKKCLLSQKAVDITC